MLRGGASAVSGANNLFFNVQRLCAQLSLTANQYGAEQDEISEENQPATP